MGEPKKFSFGFSKVVKKPNLIPAKPVETEQVEYIKCVEDKTVKLVNEEAAKPKPLPVIPMPPGSSVRDRILEAIRAREEAKSGTKSAKKEENGSIEVKVEADESKAAEGQEPSTDKVDAKPITLDEMAAKELMESAKLETTEEKKPDLVITGKGDDATKKQSSLEDYEDMPIGDFGLAMLRGMGWDPKKGIGLNEKVVIPAVPQVRPKGMGLGADKALALQNQQAKSSADELVMKKGSTLKVITGAYAGMYGKVEGFEELPGRIAVRLALGNSVVSLSEFMVQLVGPTEYSKNSKVMNLDKYAAALDSESKPSVDSTKSESRRQYVSNDNPVRRKSRSRSPSFGNSRSRSTRERSQERSTSKRHEKRDSSDSDDFRSRRSSRSPTKNTSSKSRKSHRKSSSNKDKRRRSVSSNSDGSRENRRTSCSSERLSSRTKLEKSRRSRDNSSTKEKRSNDSDFRKRNDVYSHGVDRKPKHRLESNDSDYKSSKSSFSEGRSKHRKHKSDRQDSDSDSSGRRRKKHKKSRK